MKNYLLLLPATVALMLTGSYRMNAANNLCLFKTATAPYTELSGDIDVTSQVFPGNYYTVPLGGEVLPLFGYAWPFNNLTAELSILSNGRVYVGIDTGFALFDCLYTDSVLLLDNSSKISYRIEGASGEMILKVQWRNMRIASGSANNYINMQVWIYQQTGIVEFRYGSRSADNASGYTNPVTGIYSGIWYSNGDYSVVYEKMAIKGTPPNITVDSAINISVPNIQGVPDSGTVYRFIPKLVATFVSPIAEALPSFNVAPNPASKEIIISLSQVPYPSEVILMDISGRKIRQCTIPAHCSTHRIPVNTIAPGTYQLLYNNRKTTRSHRVVINR